VDDANAIGSNVNQWRAAIPCVRQSKGDRPELCRHHADYLHLPWQLPKSHVAADHDQGCPPTHRADRVALLPGAIRCPGRTADVDHADRPRPADPAVHHPVRNSLSRASACRAASRDNPYPRMILLILDRIKDRVWRKCSLYTRGFHMRLSRKTTRRKHEPVFQCIACADRRSQ